MKPDAVHGVGPEQDLGEVFDGIYRGGGWGRTESRSGPGSTLIYTVNLRAQLPRLFASLRIGSFLDAPCGDFHWMRHVEGLGDLRYIGGDISPGVIAANEKAYGGTGYEFRVFDITRDPFPQVDLWFCRDCLFHLPYRAILDAFQNFVASEVKYLFATNHLNLSGFRNKDIPAGAFRVLDLHAAPFFLPRTKAFCIADWIHPFPAREMRLWSREEVAEAVPKMKAALADAR